MQIHPHQLLTFGSFHNDTTRRALEIRLWNQDRKGTTLVYCCFHPSVAEGDKAVWAERNSSLRWRVTGNAFLQSRST